jgi:hypothetical protein
MRKATSLCQPHLLKKYSIINNKIIKIMNPVILKDKKKLLTVKSCKYSHPNNQKTNAVKEK